jgi:hypothetical protein
MCVRGVRACVKPQARCGLLQHKRTPRGQFYPKSIPDALCSPTNLVDEEQAGQADEEGPRYRKEGQAHRQRGQRVPLPEDRQAVVHERRDLRGANEAQIERGEWAWGVHHRTIVPAYLPRRAPVKASENREAWSLCAHLGVERRPEQAHHPVAARGSTTEVEIVGDDSRKRLPKNPTRLPFPLLIGALTFVVNHTKSCQGP